MSQHDAPGELLYIMKSHREEVARLKAKSVLDNIIGFGGWLISIAILWSVYHEEPLIGPNITIERVIQCKFEDNGKSTGGDV